VTQAAPQLPKLTSSSENTFPTGSTIGENQQHVFNNHHPSNPIRVIRDPSLLGVLRVLAVSRAHNFRRTQMNTHKRTRRLSLRTRLFVEAYLSNGGNVAKATREAGYANDHANDHAIGHRRLNDPALEVVLLP
jgi:hypothetical protein